MRLAVAIAVAATLALPATAAAASTLPDCPGSRPAPRALLSGQGQLESLAFDAAGRLLFTDRTRQALMVVQRRGARPRVLASGIDDPGGIALDPKGRVYVGFGNNIANGQAAPAAGRAGLYVVDPRTGRKRVFARGLSMANGVVRAKDGTFYASDDFQPTVDRISPRGRVQRAWSTAPFTNGLALDATGRHLFANRSGAPTAILRIDTRTGRFTTWASPPAADGGAFLDGLTREGRHAVRRRLRRRRGLADRRPPPTLRPGPRRGRPQLGRRRPRTPRLPPHGALRGRLRREAAGAAAGGGVAARSVSRRPVAATPGLRRRAEGPRGGPDADHPPAAANAAPGDPTADDGRGRLPR